MITRTRARHYDRPPTHHPRIHPDWLPPTTGADDLAFDDQPALGDDPGHAMAGLAPTPHPFPLPPIPPRPPRPVPEPLPLPPDQTPADEDRALRTPVASYDAGRDATLAHTALPLRHRIYALHCEGRTISAIARTLHLDRGTVARHLQAIQTTLLAEQQTDDLAMRRLRAVEAQHAILAAAWDALAHEEALAADRDPAAPPSHPPRRAQLLAIAHRAARTAAQLQGLFTPAALAAALQPAAPSAPNCCMPASDAPITPPARGDEPGNSIAGLAPTAAVAPEAFCCMPASDAAPGNDPSSSIAGLVLTTPSARAAHAYDTARHPPPPVVQ